MPNKLSHPREGGQGGGDTGIREGGWGLRGQGMAVKGMGEEGTGEEGGAGVIPKFIGILPVLL